MKNLIKATAFSILLGLSSCETEKFTETTNEVEVIDSNISEQDSKAVSSNNWFYIINKESGKSLSVEVSNNDVVTWDYWGGDSQRWYVESVGSGYYKLTSGHGNNLTLDIAGVNRNNGGDAIVYPYVGQHNEHFKFEDAGDGYYAIVPRHSKKVLDYFSETGDVVQWDNFGSDKQKWMLVPAGGEGKLSWRWTTSNVPGEARARIEASMNAAVARYNRWGNWPARTITVEYNSSVHTADGNPNGNIRFGAKESSQGERTALHEIAHTMGVGFWEPSLINNARNFTGPKALAVYRSFEGKNANITTDNNHFWQYGLNFNREGSEVNKERHAQIVWAMRVDGLITY